MDQLSKEIKGVGLAKSTNSLENKLKAAINLAQLTYDEIDGILHYLNQGMIDDMANELGDYVIKDIIKKVESGTQKLEQARKTFESWR